MLLDEFKAIPIPAPIPGPGSLTSCLQDFICLLYACWFHGQVCFTLLLQNQHCCFPSLVPSRYLS